jgi:hypothetical protein
MGKWPCPKAQREKQIVVQLREAAGEVTIGSEMRKRRERVIDGVLQPSCEGAELVAEGVTLLFMQCATRDHMHGSFRLRCVAALA